jgi:hypothetical protein
MDIHVEDIEHYYSNTNEHDTKKIVAKIEDIPENKIPINVLKQNKNRQVSFSKENAYSTQQTKPSLPKSQAKLVRPIQPPSRPQITYDDLLSKMGMFVVNGELHLKSNNQYSQPSSQQNQNQNQNQNVNQNSYIYNKYFKDAINVNEQPQRPRTLLEYRDMLIKDIIQKAQIRKVKSKKLIMPNSNINISGPNGDLNKLFNFSHR